MGQDRALQWQLGKEPYVRRREDNHEGSPKDTEGEASRLDGHGRHAGRLGYYDGCAGGDRSHNVSEGTYVVGAYDVNQPGCQGVAACLDLW